MPTYVRCYVTGTLQVQKEDLKRVYAKMVKGPQGVPESSFWNEDFELDGNGDLSLSDDVIFIENPYLSGTTRDLEAFDEFLSITKGGAQVEFQFEGEPSTFTTYVDGKKVKSPTILELSTQVQKLDTRMKTLERQYKVSQEVNRSLNERIEELNSQLKVLIHMKSRG